jgi:O-antigen/teichoic acid export membrane protein
MVARGVDQGVLGLATLWLAGRLGPEAFAPIGALFVVNSLAIQVSDFGVGFRVFRAGPDEYLDSAGLTRLRIVNAALAAVAGVVAVLLGGDAGVVVAGSGVIWALSAEAYVRKAGCLKSAGSAPVVRAEVASAVLFGVGALAAGWARWDVTPLVVLFAAKHLVEIALTGQGLRRFRPGGARMQSSAEWFGQLLTYVIANLDFVAVSLLLGASDLSRYLIGFRLASAAPTLLATPITQVSFVELAGRSGAAAQELVDAVVRRALRLGGAGLVLGFAAAAIVPPLLGESWEGTGVVTALLACAVPWRLLLGLTVAMALTAGKPSAVVRWEAMRLAATSVVVFAAATVSIEAVAAAVAVATIVGITFEHRAAAQLIGVRPRREVLVGAALAVVVIPALAFALSG